MSYETGDIRDHGGHQASPGDIAIGVIIGRSSEFFDFFVYAIASVLVFPRVMFPFAEPLAAVLWSFAIFALAFLSRPIGTLIFMAIDRRWGRGVKLTLALFLLGCATAGIAFMPDHSVAGGYAILILAVMRTAQGLALGGTWDGLSSLLAMNAPEKHAETMTTRLRMPACASKSRKCVGRIAAPMRLCSRIAIEPSGEPCEVRKSTTRSSYGWITEPTRPIAAAMSSGVADGY